MSPWHNTVHTGLEWVTGVGRVQIQSDNLVHNYTCFETNFLDRQKFNGVLYNL